MAGYSRQSVADIIANAVIKAAPVNAEFNAIRDAFALSGGHKHDGSSTEGAYVPLIADIDALNKVVIDTANNRISFYNEVSSAAVEQIRLEDGVLKPVTDDDVDLGASGAEFKDLYIDGIGYIDSVVITGGTIDNTVIGGTTPAAADFTTMDTTGNATIGGTLGVTGTSTFTGAMSAGSLTTTGNSTHATVDINGGAIDGTIIGATSAAAGSFTTVSTSGQATLASADINGGTIDGAVIGGTTAQAITGTTITANTGFTGDLTGDVTGNVTGNLTGNITGNVTGNLTGNVTAATGSSTFNDVTINGTLNMDAATTATITNLSTPVASGDAASKGYVDTEIASLVDSAPGTLDTLNELAAALGDDPNFSTTITTSIASKLPLAGGTMTGAIAMGTSKITGLGDPTANQDAATKNYVDTQDATKLSLSGGTMTGAIDMGSSKITTTYTPTNAADLTTKTYVDAILGSATAAATSAANAATSETNAATSETNAATSATAAAASYDDFDDRYLGAKASDPSVDNDGDALVTGALYWNTTSNELYVWNGSAWEQGSFTAGSLLSNVVEDTTPQLGGDLDLNSSDITGTGNVNITGTVTATSYSGDGSGLSGINTDLVGDTTPQLGGNLDLNGNDITGTGDIDINGVVTVVSGSNERAINIYEPTSGGTQYQSIGLDTLGDLGFWSQPSISDPTIKFSVFGRVGIGVGSNRPSYPLEVSNTSGTATIAIAAGLTNYDAILNFGDPTDKDAGRIYYDTSADTMSFRAGGSGTSFTIDSSNNIGVGTSAPSVTFDIAATDAIKIPAGTTAERPTGANGMLRYNSDDAQFEGYADGAWGAIAGGGGGDTQTATTTSTTQTAIASYATSTSLGIEITVVATDTVATERTITKLLVTHDGTTAVATQYGEVNTNTAVATFDVDISGGNVRLLATAASSNSTNFTASAAILA